MKVEKKSSSHAADRCSRLCRMGTADEGPGLKEWRLKQPLQQHKGVACIDDCCELQANNRGCISCRMGQGGRGRLA